jgi:HEAT repeat protein
LIALLADGNATIRGDAAYLLGVIADPSAKEALRKLGNDPHPAVREIVDDALRGLD